MFDHSDHQHIHPQQSYTKAFVIGITLNVLFVAVEFAYGVYAGSLALIADAGHNLMDVLGLLIAWGAMALGKVKPNPKYTYGMQGASTVAALTNAMLIMLAMGALIWESLERLQTPNAVDFHIVMIVAGIGVIINTLTAWMFHREHTHDLNIKGAYLHMAADALVSVGVVIGAFIGMQTGWLWADPVLGLLIALFVVISTWSLLSDSMRLMLAGVPKHVDAVKVKAYLASLEGVEDVHDLHIWALGTTETALSTHLEMPAGHPGDEFLRDVIHELHDLFNIHHATIQIEMGNIPVHECGDC